MGSEQTLVESIGDCWRVTVEQWNRVTEPIDGTVYGGDQRPDAIGFVVANCATDAAEIAEHAYSSKSGPMTRVKAVEYVGPAWKAQ